MVAAAAAAEVVECPCLLYKYSTSQSVKDSNHS